MKVYLSKINESWIIDRIRNEWYEKNNIHSTKFINKSDIIWIISPWLWKKIPKRYLKSKKVLCSIYHIDFDTFSDSDYKDFQELDQFVDHYHVISKKTKIALSELTEKKITSIPLWVNPDNWFYIQDKKKLRSEFGFSENQYLIGSFQRDTEGSDLKSPKLIKGPDIFFEIIKKQYKTNKNLMVILTGKRRQYLINKFDVHKIPYRYFEMVNLENLNKLYNILDLYVVSSRLEGGPQAIVECGLVKTPIISTDVGIASEILSKKSIYSDINNLGVPDVKVAYENSLKLAIPNGMTKYLNLFRRMHEN